MVKSFLNEKIPKRILIFISTFILIYFILISSVITQKYDLEAGNVSNYDIKAPKDVEDTYSTEIKKEQEVATIPMQYSKNPEMKTNSMKEIDSFFFELDKLVSTDLTTEDKLASIEQQTYVILSQEDYSTLIELNKEELDSFHDIISSIMGEVLEYDIREGSSTDQSKIEASQQDEKNAQDAIDVKFKSSNLSNKLREIGISIGYSKLEPNFFYDEEKTEKLKEEAIEMVQPILVKKGETIVREGEKVTERDISVLQELGLLDNDFNTYTYIVIGVLVLMYLILSWIYLYKYHINIFRNWKRLILISVLAIISLLLARTLKIISPMIIPLACVPMLMTLLIDDKVSLVLNLMTCILISVVVQFNIEVTLLALVNCLLGAITLKKLQQRNDILYISLIIGIISFSMSFSIGFLLSSNAVEILQKSGLAFIGSTLSSILTIGFLPFFESAFDIVTTIKLLELSNPNHPLQKRLLMEAPGTYHHSVLVANLSELAAERVGGNPVLARASAYYHDVGKLKRPMFFSENQIGKDNPHNNINPNLSTLIITSHVKDGLELAKEYRLPGVIRDAIEQHHGTSLVKYFYITAKNSAEKPEEIKEEDFMYPGPIPESKEVAIMMLADSVEAAVRSIVEPTQGKIEEMVNKIIKGKFNENQLDNCDLTLKDLNAIREAFLKVLSGIYHQRIEYPTEKSVK
ncbi:HD family phosphohydrolase [Clostridium sp. DL1XJH146]